MPVTTFGTPTDRKEFKSDYKKVAFLDMNNTSTVRILTKDRLEIETHYINRITVRCSGDDCPVCANNKVLIMQFPETFRDEAKYSPRRTAKLVNVLDKTLVRTCSKCQTEVPTAKGQPPIACKCGEILSGEPLPSNKVKVLSRGISLFDQLDAIHNAVLDASGEKIGLTGYDITFVISGAGKSKVITPIPGQVSPITPVDEADLYNLEEVTVSLAPGEILDLQRGVMLKDIFVARRATAKLEQSPTEIVSPEVLASIEDDVDALFPK
jgi:hypothetical protein